MASLTMHTIRTLLLLWLVALSATAQNTLVFEENGFKAAMAKAKAENKILFYMLYADWCPHCKKMKAEVFTDPKVVSFMSQHFVC
ncbi:MAG TPA: thioredoxin family protein, partial [Flavobacterium sp.]|nr:thioredoxin family protein [Flavobacterium sp.]